MVFFLYRKIFHLCNEVLFFFLFSFAKTPASCISRKKKPKTLTGQNHQIFYDSIKLNIGTAYYLAHGNFIAPYNTCYLLQHALNQVILLL